MTLRQSIRIRISEFESDIRQANGSDARYRIRNACTDDILDLVREALLRDETLLLVVPDSEDYPKFMATARDQFRRKLETALDAVTGEADR